MAKQKKVPRVARVEPIGPVEWLPDGKAHVEGLRLIGFKGETVKELGPGVVELEYIHSDSDN